MAECKVHFATTIQGGQIKKPKGLLSEFVDTYFSRLVAIPSAHATAELFRNQAKRTKRWQQMKKAFLDATHFQGKPVIRDVTLTSGSEAKIPALACVPFRQPGAAAIPLFE